MKIHEQPLQWYVDRLKRGDHFSFAGYSDAEWLCILGLRAGDRTALGQVICPTYGKKLFDVLRRRQGDPRWLTAVPKCLWEADVFGDGIIDRVLHHRGVRIEGWERDMVLDDAAAGAELFPLIDQLRRMDTVMIGNSDLEPVAGLLGCKFFVGVPSPNLHLEKGPEGIDWVVNDLLDEPRVPAVYLVSAGVSAAVIIDRLHDEIPNSSFIDCGSIWDAFVGIGAQREWRRALYADLNAWQRWTEENLHGKTT